MSRLVDLNDTAYSNLERLKGAPPSFYNGFNSDPFADREPVVEKPAVPVPRAAYYEHLLTDHDRYVANKSRSHNSSVSSLLSQTDIAASRPSPPPPTESQVFPPPKHPLPHHQRSTLPDQTPYVQAMHYHAMLRRHVMEVSKNNSPHPSNSLSVSEALMSDTAGKPPERRTTSQDAYVYRGADSGRSNVSRGRPDPPLNNQGTGLRRSEAEGERAPNNLLAGKTSAGMRMALAGGGGDEVIYVSVARGDAERAETFRRRAAEEERGGERRKQAEQIKARCAKDNVAASMFFDEEWR